MNAIRQIKNKTAVGFLYFATTVLIVAGVIGSLLSAQFVSSMRSSIIDSDQRTLKQVCASMDAIVHKNNQLCFILSSDNSVITFAESYEKKDFPAMLEAADKLRNMILASPHIVCVDIYFPTLGIVYMVNNGVVTVEQYTDTAVIDYIEQHHGESRQIFSREIHDIHTGRRIEVTTELYPTRYVGNEPYSIAIINQSTTLYSDMLSGLATRMDLGLVVFDDKGSALATSNEWNPSVSTDELYSILVDRSGYFTTELDGESFFVIYQTDPLRSWKYVSITPEKSLFSPTMTFLRISAIITIIGVLTGIAVSVVFSSRLQKPLIKLARKLGGNPGQSTTLEYIENSIDLLQSQNVSIEKTLAEYLPTMKNRVLSDLLCGQYSQTDDLLERFDYYHIQFDGTDAYCVFVLLLDTRPNSKYLQHQINMLSIYIMEQLQQLFHEPCDGTTVNIGSNEIAAIVRIGTPSSDLEAKIEAFGRKLAASVSESMNHVIEIGVGGAFQISAIEKSYIQAKVSLSHRYVRGHGRLLYYHQLPKSSLSASNYPNEVESHLIAAIQQAKEDNANEYLGHILSIIYLPGEQSESLRTFRLLRLLGILEKTLREHGVPAHTHSKTYDDMLSCAQDEQKLLEWFTIFISGAFSKATPPRGGVRLSEEISSYIRKNYSDNGLSLNKLSSEFYFSTSYLSRLFREETNLSIKQYITQIRMEKAKELLISSSETGIANIGVLVGYDKVHSFLKQFKDYYGMTPGQYREKHS